MDALDQPGALLHPQAICNPKGEQSIYRDLLKTRAKGILSWQSY